MLWPSDDAAGCATPGRDFRQSLRRFSCLPESIHTSPRTRRLLVFSAAHPGQEGVGHISPRTQEDWQATFVEAGLRFMPKLTHLVRRLSDTRNINHRANLLVRSLCGGGRKCACVL